MKKLMVAIAAAAISFAGFAEGSWFTAGFTGEESTGGAWLPGQDEVTEPIFSDGKLVLEDVEATAPVVFQATDSKETDEATVVFRSAVNFVGFDELPAIDATAKAGVCALTDGNYWVVSYDSEGATNKWFDTGITAILDSADTVTVSVSTNVAVYSFACYEGDIECPINGNEFQEVCYSGNGTVTSLEADHAFNGLVINLPVIDGLIVSCDKERAAVGSEVTVNFAAGTKIPSKGSAIYIVQENGNLTIKPGDSEPEAYEPAAKIDDELYLTFAEAYTNAAAGATIELCANQDLAIDIEKSITVDLAGKVMTVSKDVKIDGTANTIALTFADSGEIKGSLVLGNAFTVKGMSAMLNVSAINVASEGGYLTGVEGSVVLDAEGGSPNSKLAIFDPEIPSLIVYVGDASYVGAPSERFVIEGEVAFATIGDAYVDSFASVQSAIDAGADEIQLFFEYGGVTAVPDEEISFESSTVVYAATGADDLDGVDLLPTGKVTFDGARGAWVYSGEPPTPTSYAVTFSTNDVEVVEAETTVEDGEMLDSDQIPEFEGGAWDIDPSLAVITCDTNFNYTIAAPVPTYTLTFPLRNEGVHALVTNLTTGAFWNFDGPSTNSVVVEEGSFVTEILSSTKPGYEASGTTISWSNIKKDIEFPEFEARPIKYTITYHDATVTNGVFEYTIETETFALPTSENGVEAMPGGNFLGWTNSVGVAVTEVEKGKTGNLDFYANWEAAGIFYPTYIPDDDGIKEKFNDWATNKNGGDRDGASANIDAFLLNCAPADVETAKTAFKIISITKTEDGWVCKVAGEKGEGAEYGNGYVHFVSVKEKFGSDGTSSDFFQATLTLENPATE